MESLVKIAEIDHVVFRCRDQNKMLDFYTRLMGLVEERRLDTDRTDSASRRPQYDRSGAMRGAERIER